MATQQVVPPDATGPQLKPAFHHDYKVGERVKIGILGPGLTGKTGEIVGIATAGVVFTYIVLLDDPIPAPNPYGGKPWRAVSITGGCLEYPS